MDIQESLDEINEGIFQIASNAWDVAYKDYKRLLTLPEDSPVFLAEKREIEEKMIALEKDTLSIANLFFDLVKFMRIGNTHAMDYTEGISTESKLTLPHFEMPKT